MCEFCCIRLMCFDSVRGQNSPSPIDLAGRRTAQPVMGLVSGPTALALRADLTNARPDNYC